MPPLNNFIHGPALRLWVDVFVAPTTVNVEMTISELLSTQSWPILISYAITWQALENTEYYAILSFTRSVETITRLVI